MKKIETLIPKTEVTMTKKAKVTIFFRPTVLHDHAASRLVKTDNHDLTSNVAS